MSSDTLRVVLVASIAVVLLVRWLRRGTGVLSFFDLDDGAQLKYMELANKIDTRLGEKFRRALPIRIGMAIVTGGSSLATSAVRQGYQLVKNGRAKDAVKDHVKRESRRLRRRHVNWSTFPGAHVVIGGPPLSRATGQKLLCPLCKTTAMHRFVAGEAREVLYCDACSKSIVVKANRASGLPAEVLIPGLFAAAIPVSGEIAHIASDVGHTLVEQLNLEHLLDHLFDLLG